MLAEDGVFTRKLDVETAGRTLTLYQRQVGDVSCVVWDAAIVLAKYLDASCRGAGAGVDWLRGKKVLELGAGLGCVGMTAACLGADALMTDLPEALPMLRANIEGNREHWKGSGGSARAEVLEWGADARVQFEPDVVLLADCVYYKESIKPLLDTLSELLGAEKHVYALLSQEERDTPLQIPVWREFTGELERRFAVQPVPRAAQHPLYSSPDIHLLKLTKP